MNLHCPTLSNGCQKMLREYEWHEIVEPTGGGIFRGGETAKRYERHANGYWYEELGSGAFTWEGLLKKERRLTEMEPSPKVGDILNNNNLSGLPVTSIVCLTGENPLYSEPFVKVGNGKWVRIMAGTVVPYAESSMVHHYKIKWLPNA